MILPRPQLTPGYDNTFVSGSGFKDIASLLLDLHLGVLELGVGDTQVRVYDNPGIRKLGFYLTSKRDPSRDWLFIIGTSDFQNSIGSLPEGLRAAFGTHQWGQRLALLLEGGLHPDQLESELAGLSTKSKPSMD
jgi:hypothetical protein